MSERDKDREKIIVWIIVAILIIPLLALDFFIIKWLWNWLMPVLFGVGQITFWQAAGIFILVRCIWGTGFKYRNSS